MCCQSSTTFLTWGAAGWSALWLPIIDGDSRKQHLKLSQYCAFTSGKNMKPFLNLSYEIVKEL